MLQSAEAVESHHREVERSAAELSCIVRSPPDVQSMIVRSPPDDHYVQNMICLGDAILSRIIYFRLLLLLARLSVGLPDEEANKLEAALTPLVHNGQEQVDFDCDDDHHL